MQALTQAEAAQLAPVLHQISRPFLDPAVRRAVRQHGRLVYDGDLTGRPVSNTRTPYPGAADGHMSDGVPLGYQAARVSLHRPTYGRLGLGVPPLPATPSPAAKPQRWCGPPPPSPARVPGAG